MRKFLITTLAAAVLLLEACSNSAEQVSDIKTTDTAAETHSEKTEASEPVSMVPTEQEIAEKITEAEDGDFSYIENDSGEIIIKQYIGKEKDVVFPAVIGGKPVVQIGYDYNTVVSEDIESVYIHAVERIGGWAFSNCKNLSKVTLSDGIKEIDSGAFLRCEKLTEIVLPDSLEMIGSMAFSECGIVEINIPGSVKVIRSGAFAECGELIGVTFSEGLEVIDSQAFCECEKLTEITFPDSVKEIGLDAFRNCGVKKVTLPDGLEGFEGARTFTDCEVVYKGETYTPELYGELYKAIHGEYYKPPTGIPPAA